MRPGASRRNVSPRTYGRQVRVHAVQMKSASPSHLEQADIPNTDDRVTEDIFDIDDERAEVDIIVHGLAHDEY